MVQILIGFSVGLSGTLIPGPLLAYIVMKTPTSGPRTEVFAAGGHLMVEFGILSLIALGLGFVLRSELFQTSIALIGGTLLLVVGFSHLTRVGRARQFRISSTNFTGLEHHPLVGGVLFSSLLNPSVVLWWATIGQATLMEAVLVAALPGAIFWLIGHFLADLSWFSLVSYSVARGKRVIGTKIYKGLMIVCGCVLLAFGAYFVARYGLPLFA